MSLKETPKHERLAETNNWRSGYDGDDTATLASLAAKAYKKYAGSRTEWTGDEDGTVLMNEFITGEFADKDVLQQARASKIVLEGGRIVITLARDDDESAVKFSVIVSRDYNNFGANEESKKLSDSSDEDIYFQAASDDKALRRGEYYINCGREYDNSRYEDRASMGEKTFSLTARGRD